MPTLPYHRYRGSILAKVNAWLPYLQAVYLGLTLLAVDVDILA